MWKLLRVHPDKPQRWYEKRFFKTKDAHQPNQEG